MDYNNFLIFPITRFPFFLVTGDVAHFENNLKNMSGPPDNTGSLLKNEIGLVETSFRMITNVSHACTSCANICISCGALIVK